MILRRPAAFAALFALLLTACHGDSTASAAGNARGGRHSKKAGAVFPVEVERAQERQVTYAVHAAGSLMAMDNVQVTARVAGVVEKIRFMEGSHVEKGAVLAEIEPERFRLAVASARASFDKAKAAASEAKAAYQRRDKLTRRSPGLVSAEELEQYAGRYRTAQAEEALAKAALDLAELNLRDAYVRAPMAGVMETRSVQTGRYVQPGTALATMIRREPLLLETFVAPEEAARLSADMTANFEADGKAGLTARIRHIGQAASETSRRVRVVAEVKGAGKTRRPGEFVKVTIPLTASQPSIVIPLRAVRPSERGFLAYVASDEGIAHERVLKLGLRTEDGMVEILDGIRPGDDVVVRGAEALFEGARLRMERAGESQEKSPAGRAGEDAGSADPVRDSAS